MNFFGINSAPVNGSAFVVVLGAALIAGSSGAQAVPTNTTPGAANAVTVTANVTAIGVRNVLGGGTSSTASTSSAQWVIATSASAGVTITASGRATSTDAYGIGGSSGGATGTIIQPGKALGDAHSGATATGNRTAGTLTFASTATWATADASVKRVGQSTTERDGYAVIASTATVLVDASKSTLGEAIGAAYSASYADGVRIHGGQAVISCVLTISATGAYETAVAITTSTSTAIPTLTMFSAASASSTALVTADSTASRSGGMCMAYAASTASATGRFALQGGARPAFASSATANGRLALLGGATVSASSIASAEPTATRFSFAAVPSTATAMASGTRICMGGSLLASSAAVTADAIANPATPAPFNRTMRVPAESRAMRVPYENRTMRVVE